LKGTIRRLAASIESRQPLPAWAAAPLLVVGVSLVIAVTGMLWDVGYHIDHGRDLKNLFTAPHLFILFGLLGIGAGALASIVFATYSDDRPGLALGPFRMPYAGLPLLVMATGSVLGFPLDALWHQVYGIDVTLWSPTHLLMIGGAVFATFALCLVIAEGRAARGWAPVRPWQGVLTLGSVVVGLSVFGVEFDFGVPQWQAVFQPLLVAITAGLGLVMARAAFGPGGAVAATLFNLVLRILLAIFVTSLGYTFPAFPLLLGMAACVELAFLLENRLPAIGVAAVAGLLIATVGMATEWLWVRVLYPIQWQPAMLPRLWLPGLAAIASAMVGMALGRVLSGRPSGLPVAVTALAVVVLPVLLAIPLPRNGDNLNAHLTALASGPQRPAKDRYGQPSYEQDMRVTVALDRPATQGADWFTIVAWQGGGRRLVHLTQVGPNTWQADQPIPTGGGWKSIVFLAQGDKMLSAPIYLPPDPTYGISGYQAEPDVTRPFVPSPKLITSESHGGPPGVAILAYIAFFVTAAGWVLSLALAANRVSSARAAAGETAAPRLVAPGRGVPGPGRDGPADRSQPRPAGESRDDADLRRQHGPPPRVQRRLPHL